MNIYVLIDPFGNEILRTEKSGEAMGAAKRYKERGYKVKIYKSKSKNDRIKRK